MLFNIARCSVSDEPALLQHLCDHRFGGAARNVFWNEPSIDPCFAELDNVMLQPHRSSATVETRTAMASLVRDNLQALFNGEPLLTEYTQYTQYTR
ncbi:NAD(P)-dependent oxidoreductase [Caballeronia sp. dw_19]|uniref:NAD(P)-dependent oxidoreductase n=1 Tax=Caballeronia sp. dw_19 TaxID=2719791 RepID=UPI001BD469D4|nr:NAD(P)-dependent oxidoreductase [Caballeronia sp. dw_19]